MALKKYLGKISSVQFGLGGYQEAMIGLHLCFEFDGSGICTSHSGWDYITIEHTKRCKWTEESRGLNYAEIMRKVSKLLNEAGVRHISELKGIPVEVKLDGNNFYSFRILKEVL